MRGAIVLAFTAIALAWTGLTPDSAQACDRPYYGGGYYGGGYYGGGYYGGGYYGGSYYGGVAYSPYYPMYVGSPVVYSRPMYYGPPTVYGRTTYYEPPIVYGRRVSYDPPVVYSRSMYYQPPVDSQPAERIDRPAGSTTVGMYDDRFDPPTLTVPSGTTVRWVNNGIRNHTVTSATNDWDSGDLAPGQSYSATFKTPGVHEYFSQHHKDMRGRIIVK